MNLHIALAKEFDESVSQYNAWLTSLENPKTQRLKMMGAFIRGMGLVLNIFTPSSTELLRDSDPLYSREDLTLKQKEAIALASDWQRVGKTLEKIISGDLINGEISFEDATQGKSFVQQMYEHFRNVYVTNKIR